MVITGIGLIGPLGASLEESVASLRAGRVCFRPSPHDARVAVAPVEGFSMRAHTGPYKDGRYLNRGAAFAVAAALQALGQADLTPAQRERAGLFLGAGPNLDPDGPGGAGALPGDEPEGAHALGMLRYLPNTASAAIARLAGVHGENATLCAACAASTQAIGEAFRRVRDGYLELALAGGGDSRLGRGGLSAYRRAKALAVEWAHPGEAIRPFDERRCGFAPGEGGAAFVLETLEGAQARGARILAEICGFGCSLDGASLTAPLPTGKWAEQALRSALEDAGLGPSQIGVVASHGTGTALNDAMEAALLERLFSATRPAVLALKSWVGHGAAAAGALELALLVGSLRGGLLPPIRNLTRPISAAIAFQREPGPTEAQNALLQSFGFGGQNSALVVKAWPA